MIEEKITMSSESSDMETSFDSDDSKSILSLDTNLKMKGIYQCRVSPRTQETSNDSSDDDSAYTDEPLADAG